MTQMTPNDPVRFYDMIGKHYPANQLPEREPVAKMGQKVTPYEGTPPAIGMPRAGLSVVDRKNTLGWGLVILAVGIVIAAKMLERAFS